jgi:hypothetical protein
MASNSAQSARGESSHTSYGSTLEDPEKPPRSSMLNACGEREHSVSRGANLSRDARARAALRRSNADSPPTQKSVVPPPPASSTHVTPPPSTARCTGPTWHAPAAPTVRTLYEARGAAPAPRGRRGQLFPDEESEEAPKRARRGQNLGGHPAPCWRGARMQPGKQTAHRRENRAIPGMVPPSVGS